MNVGRVNRGNGPLDHFDHRLAAGDISPYSDLVRKYYANRKKSVSISMLIFGIGVGIFILIIIWVVALLACCFSAHFNRHLGLYAVLVAALITIVLYCIPKEEYLGDSDKVYDLLFIWRIIIVIFLFIVALATSTICLGSFLTERQTVERVRD